MDENIVVAYNVYGYTGRWYESYLDLLFLRARWYAAESGTFLSRDSWEGDQIRPISLHPYQYAALNPINRVDPSGFCDVVGATACQRFVSEVKCIIEGVRTARECSLLNLVSEETLVLDLLAYYYSGIPYSLGSLYLPMWPQESTWLPGVNRDRWSVPTWDQNPDHVWDHPINQRDSDLGRTMRQGYGFKRPYFEQSHHFFAFLKFAYHLGGPAIEWKNKQREIQDQLQPSLIEWQRNPDSPAHAAFYAWNYRESVYDLYVVHEAAELALAVAWIGVDIIPAKLEGWCANNEAEVWSLESEVDQFFFDFPNEYWPDEQYWPGKYP